MEHWMGVNLPYQMKLTVMVPFRKGPLWYFNINGCFCTRVDIEERRRFEEDEVEQKYCASGRIVI